MSRYSESESNNLEFKEKMTDSHHFLREVIAFCNTFGGRILIGIRDDGAIVGVSDDEAESLLESVPQTIYQSVHPNVMPKVYTQRIDGRLVVAIQVSEGMNKPYFQKSKGLDAGTFVRVGRSSIKADASVIRDLEWRNKGRSPDERPMYGASVRDIDEEALRRFLTQKKIRNHKSNLWEIARSYRLICEDQGEMYPTVAGILLFGKDPQEWLPESYIVCSQIRGNEGREIVRTIDCKGDLFSQFNTAYNFILESIPKKFVIKGKKREETFQIPEIGIREVLMNAIVHRDYNVQGPTKVALFENRLEIFSPGSFPGPLQPWGLEDGITYIRNTYTCKVFREAGYIEKMGTGFRELFRLYRIYGLQDPQIVEGENFIKAILPRSVKKQVLDSGHQEILSILYEKDGISISEIRQKTAFSKATVGRALHAMVEGGGYSQGGKGAIDSVLYRVP